MDITDRLKAVIGDATLDQFAASINESTQRIKDVLRQKQKPPAEMLVAIHLKHGVDLNWLLAGDTAQPKMLLSVREASLLDNYRSAADEGRKAIEQTSAAVSKKLPTRKTQDKDSSVLHRSIAENQNLKKAA